MSEAGSSTRSVTPEPSVDTDYVSNDERDAQVTPDLEEEDDYPDEEGPSGESEDSDLEDVDSSVAEDMRKLEDTFEGISERYRLINRIGEGTFSTVYKAQDLLYDQYNNDWEDQNSGQALETNPAKRRRLGDSHVPVSEPQQPRRKRKIHYVALKKIYVTSSPSRILNELQLLKDLRGCRSVCPLITAFRHQDQVVAVLPYFPHTDFRLQYRTFLVSDMRHYFHSLLTALHAVHKESIIHRDIKPTNFLYNPELKRGVLVDFGLAEYDCFGGEPCLCEESPRTRSHRYMASKANNRDPLDLPGYPKNDSRPSRRANRAGTRGFRAPEVLFKCTAQTTKIDIWSVGVILLTLLGRRFPFFNSVDDVDALIEMASIFGKARMKAAALLHGQVFETTIPTIGEKGHSLEKIVLWSSCVESLTESEKQGARFVTRLMELDPSKRLSAREALRDEFFTQPEEDDLAWGGDGNDPSVTIIKTGEKAAEEKKDEAAAEVADEVQLV